MKLFSLINVNTCFLSCILGLIPADISINDEINEIMINTPLEI